jgi:2-amino-4-hydroxy-6-hydroxymethyldihydropteridine diphosphokinase
MIYLLLGSNEGNREANLRAALRLIEFRVGEIVKTSLIYETEPWGLKEQAPFYNMAVEVRTNLNPIDLVVATRSIESEAGRQPTIKWGPRVLDIDILAYDNIALNTDELTIPHPLMQERRFALVPLNEIAPNLTHPVLGKTIGMLLAECEDKGEVTTVWKLKNS